MTQLKIPDLGGAHDVELIFRGVDAQLSTPLFQLGTAQVTLLHQLITCSPGHMLPVHFKETTQCGASITATKAVGPQYLVATPLRNVWADLIGIRLHMVGGRDNGASRAFQQAGHIRHRLRLTIAVPKQVRRSASWLRLLLKAEYVASW